MNKKVSQLVSITAPELVSGDLLYIIDISAKEGKKITLDQIGSYLNVSGSLISVRSTLADTASFILGSKVYGSVANSLVSVYATSSLSSSWSATTPTASFAITASYVLSSITNLSSSFASASTSASYANNSTISTLASASNYLNYVGNNNGTASYSLVSQNVLSSSYAKRATTASFIDSTVASVTSASYANKSGYSDTSGTSSYATQLIYPNLSTASYALSAGNFSSNNFRDYGVFLAITQSISSSQLDLVRILNVPAVSNIEAVGTVTVFYTSSIPLNEHVDLMLFSRDTGTSTILDSTPIYVNISKTVNTWDSLMSGSIKIPYTLIGSASMLGDYLLSVTGSSNNIQIDSARINRFKISSLSDNLLVSSYELPSFTISPISGTLISYSASNLSAGLHNDYRDAMMSNGAQNILTVDISNKSITSARYVWSLTKLLSFNCSNNVGLTTITGLPNSIISMSCQSCYISSLPNMTATSMSYFNASFNNLSTFPLLPATTSYVSCSNNNITDISSLLPTSCSILNLSYNNISALPVSFSFGLRELYLNNNTIGSIGSYLPNSIYTMSFNGNPLSMFAVNLPTALKYVDVGNTNITSFPSLPPSLLYLNLSNCALTTTAMDTICSQSYSAGLNSGSIYINGNGQPLPSTVNNYILPMILSRDWTIVYDL